MIGHHWTELHQAIWKGMRRNIRKHLPLTISSSKGLSPLYLGIERWGGSIPHQKMIEILWDADPAPQLARWGDTAWGGGLTLLDLVIQKGLIHYIERCKACGLAPHERTWSMALLHDQDEPMIALGLAYDAPDYLPEDQQRVRKMKAARLARDIENATGAASSDGGARRL